MAVRLPLLSKLVSCLRRLYPSAMAAPATRSASCAPVLRSYWVDMESCIGGARVTSPVSSGSGVFVSQLALVTTCFHTLLLCCHSATKISNRAAGMRFVLVNRMNPSFVGGVRRNFSSSSSTQDEFLRGCRKSAVEAEKRACKAEPEAQKAVWETEWESWRAERTAYNAAFNKFTRNMVYLWGFTASCWIVAFCSRSSHDGRSSNDGQSYGTRPSGDKPAYQ